MRGIIAVFRWRASFVDNKMEMGINGNYYKKKPWQVYNSQCFPFNWKIGPFG